MADDSFDPYVYPGTSVLVNRLEITDPTEFSVVERRLSWAGRLSLESDPVAQTYDMDHVCAIHARLFSSLYSWAGRLRNVDLAKGDTHFLPHQFLSQGSEYFSHLVAESPLLNSDVSADVFVIGAAKILTVLNDIHPFREGNGRTQRAFIDDLAKISHRQITWRNVTKQEMMTASARAANDDSDQTDWTYFADLFLAMLEQPLDGSSVLEPEIYSTQGADNVLKKWKGHLSTEDQ